MVSERPPFPVEPEVMAVLETLWTAGHGAYLVGGGVRDGLLGIESSDIDWDVATDARPEQILKIFPGSTYQNRFGTVLARGYEITTFRRDHRYADHRRPEKVTFSDDVYEDLARRDLTINAIAWGRRGPDAAARRLDPADGMGDLEARLVRAVGDPVRRFDEDALRLLRAVRIAARLDFTIEPVTFAAMAAHASDIAWVSEERVGNELRRMLRQGTPSRAFRLMDETGILAVTLPELADLSESAGGAELPDLAEREPDAERSGPDRPDRDAGSAAGHSPFDHALKTLDATVAAAGTAVGRERLALAALLHVIGAESAHTVLERLRVSGRDADAICRLIETLPTDYSTDWSDADVRRYMRRVSENLLDDLQSLRRAHDEAEADTDAAARNRELATRVEAQRAASVPLTLADLAIDGSDLRQTLGVPESPTIGRILDELLDDVIEDPRLNERMTLLTRANLILDELVHQDPSQRGSPQPTRAAGPADKRGIG